MRRARSASRSKLAFNEKVIRIIYFGLGGRILCLMFRSASSVPILDSVGKVWEVDRKNHSYSFHIARMLQTVGGLLIVVAGLLILVFDYP